MFKKLVSFFLCLAMVLLMNPTKVLAEENVYVEVDTYQELDSHLIDVFQDNGYRETIIGDSKNVKIGNCIEIYEVLKGDIIVEMEMDYYPVFVDGIIRCGLYKWENQVQMLEGYAEILNECKGNEVAIVLGENRSYVLDKTDGQVMEAYSYTDGIGNREDITVASNLIYNENIEYSKLSEIYDVSLDEMGISLLADGVMPTVAISVPRILQTSSNICWAASTASIGNYFTDYNYSAEYVARAKYGSNYNQPASLTVSRSMLSSLYNVSFSKQSTTTAPTEERIYNNISSGCPLYGRWSCSSGSTHQTVIRGINHTSGYIYVMDPLQGNVIAYGAGSNFSYTGTSGYTFTLIGYASKY